VATPGIRMEKARRRKFWTRLTKCSRRSLKTREEIGHLGDSGCSDPAEHIPLMRFSYRTWRSTYFGQFSQPSTIAGGLASGTSGR
jgi:hypothetical protein